MYEPRTYSETSDESKDEIHGDAHASGLQSAANQSHNGRDEDGALSTEHIGGFDAGEAADEATGLEEAIDGADELRGVGASVELEVGDEGRLAERGGDDAGAVAVGHAAEGDEADDLGGESAARSFRGVAVQQVLTCDDGRCGGLRCIHRNM